MTPEIEALRKNIDSIEGQLISLLNERARQVLEIGRIKKKQGLPIVDSKRENLILNRVVQKNPGPVSNDFLIDIFKKIIEESVRLEST
ncbi:MAG: chorismate mutase [Fibromonadaceae bacterium]|jgi:chorismate mutase|nr:chorismate mutase [Fibromonadaceae bacterium]